MYGVLSIIEPQLKNGNNMMKMSLATAASFGLTRKQKCKVYQVTPVSTHSAGASKGQLAFTKQISSKPCPKDHHPCSHASHHLSTKSHRLAIPCLSTKFPSDHPELVQFGSGHKSDAQPHSKFGTESHGEQEELVVSVQAKVR